MSADVPLIEPRQRAGTARRSLWRACLAVLAAAALLGALAAPAQAAAPKPKVNLVTKTQAKVLAKRAVVVRVRVAKRARVNARGRVTIHLGDGTRIQLKPRRNRFRGAHRFRWKLTEAQTEFFFMAIERCARMTVQATAKASKGGKAKRMKLRAPLRRPKGCR